MVKECKEISKEIFDRCVGGVVPDEDFHLVFTKCEIFGYGVYQPKVFSENGKYYVEYKRGSTYD